MAEIGLAASIIAVIQITTSVAKQAYKYGQSVKNAKQDMTELSQQLQNVEIVLVKLKDLVDRESKAGRSLHLWPTLLSLNNPGGAFKQCKSALTALSADIKPPDSWMAKSKQRALWPATKKKVEPRLEEIEKTKGIFLTFLDIEHMGQSLETAHVVTEISKAQIDDKRDEIIRWLSKNTDPDISQALARKKHQDETGEWFTDSEEYKSWMKEPNSFLWLYGIPGCGKTILGSEIIEQTRQYCADEPSNRALVYFYFSFRDTEKQKVSNLLSSILSQLVRQADFVSDTVRALYDSYYHNFHRNTFLIIDALDECPNNSGEREELCSTLVEMKEWSASNLHILVTGRREPGLIESLEPLCTTNPIYIQGAAVKSDIRKCSAETQDEIEQTLVEGANRMFPWVDLQLDSLKKCLTAGDVKKTLRSLPGTLNETYDRILLGIDKNHHQKVFIALQWICHSCEPLTIEELAEAVIIDLAASPSFDPRDRIPDPHWLLEILSGLVLISKRNRYFFFSGQPEVQAIEIAHFSVKEYLNSPEILSGPASVFHISESSAIEDIVKRSLLYMTCYLVSEEKSVSLRDFEEFPLLLYASYCWHKHLPLVEGSIATQTKDLVLEFLASKLVISSWLQICIPEWELFSKPFVSKQRYDVGPPLYYLAYFDCCNLVQYSIDRGVDVNAKGGLYGTTLHAAAYKGHTNTAKLLLKAGADVNVKGGLYGTALHAAAYKGHTNTAKLLLKAGADVNAQAGCLRTALQFAAYQGVTNIAKLLLEAGADVNAQAGPFGTALQTAVVIGHINTIKLLLEAGADVNAQAGCFGTALQMAAFYGRLIQLELLLEAGANFDVPGGKYGNAFNTACYLGEVICVKRLLKAGADVNAIDEPYGTPIQAALSGVSSGRLKDCAEVIEVLQVAGAETSEEDIAQIQELREKLSKDPVS